jgi:membrane protein implicated in regulation of membrane protease activity
MIDLVRDLHWWHWWIAAAALATLETFIPGAVAIWFAAAALVVGTLLLVLPLPWQLQLVLFGVLGLAAMALWRRYHRQEEHDSTQAPLNQRGVHYIGQSYVLVEPLEHGKGKVRIGDGVWLVRGPDRPKGAHVRVVGIDGAVLIVEPDI